MLADGTRLGSGALRKISLTGVRGVFGCWTLPRNLMCQILAEPKPSATRCTADKGLEVHEVTCLVC